jgi:predicted ester cyclase
MSTEENKALVLGWIEARMAKDVESAVEVWAEELQDWFRSAFNSSVQGFPDAHVTVDDLVAEKDKVMMRGTMRATHLGTWQGVPPSGKKVEWQFVDTYTVKDGKLSAIVRVAPDLKALLLAGS